jgi:hypothetical protein
MRPFRRPRPGEELLDLAKIDVAVLRAVDQGLATHHFAPGSPAERFARLPG